MARLDWDRERRRKSARRAKPQLQLRLERELAAATSRFFAESQPQNKRKQRAQAIESRYTTKLPFLATIKAGDRNGAQQRQSDSGRSCANSPPRLGQAFRRSAPAVRSQSQRRAPRGGLRSEAGQARQAGQVRTSSARCRFSEVRLASRDELGERLQRSGSLELAAAIEAEVENMLPRGLELRIGKRSRLVERSAVPPLLRPEASALDKFFECQSFSCHDGQSRAECGQKRECRQRGRREIN
jgi:hypothetical protein